MNDNVTVAPSSAFHLGNSNLDPRTTIDVGPGGNIVNIGNGVTGIVRIKVKGKPQKVHIADNIKIFGVLEIACARHGVEIKIDQSCTFQGHVRLFSHEQSSIHIGSDCMFSGDILMTTSDMHGILDIDGKRINHPSSVAIGDHVWVGAYARILKGVSIGAGSVVGMQSVVTKGVYPEACILAGNPARVIREKIRWTRDIPDEPRED